MAELIVNVEKVRKVERHPNADRLDLATVRGWQCVVGRDSVSEGDLVVYLPIDSVLPAGLEDIIFEGSKVKLSKSRVRTIRIRGAVSQGLAVPYLKLADHYTGLRPREGFDAKDVLGVTKWEPKEPAPFTTRGGMQRSKKQVNPNFRKYTSIQHLKNYPDAIDGEEQVAITEKIHGCLNGDTLISLANGDRMPIKEIVRNRIDVDVLAIDDNGELAVSRITNWYDNGISDKWKRVKITRNNLGKGNHYISLMVTPNHRFYNPDSRTYVRCDELRPGDAILSKRQNIEIPFFQRETLKGKMLGDGTLTNNSVTFGHKLEHIDYVEYSMKALGEFAGNMQKPTSSGYGTKMIRGKTKAFGEISDLFETWFENGDKQVPNDVSLSPISLAFWYMDDGSYAGEPNQENRISIATCGFNENSIDNLLHAMSRMGINATKSCHDYWRINLNACESDKFFTLIAPYITTCMQYKLPKQYRGKFNDCVLNAQKMTFKPTLVRQTVISIEDVENIKNYNRTRWDIETEHHNFIANNVVVHNSNFRAGYVPIHAETWYGRLWKRIRSRFDRRNFRHPGYEFVYGSHNVQLQELTSRNRRLRGGNFGRKKNVYAQTADAYRLRDVLGPGEVVYGEVYGEGIQKGYGYGLVGEIRLAVFDVMSHGEWMDTFVLRSFCAEKGLPVVPLLYAGRLDLSKGVDHYVSGPSVLCPSQKVREGCVLRPTRESRGHMGRRVFKYINPSYLLQKGNTEYH